MPEPWDRPSLVREGDTNPNHTYLVVGRVLSQWEGVEIQLGYIYTAAVGKHGDWWALLEYGEGSAFLGRFIILQKAISNLFVKLPNQEVEGKLDCFLTKVSNFATRRHDVARSQLGQLAAPARSGRHYGVFLTPVSLQGPRLRLIGASDLRLYGAINGSTPSPANSAGDGGYGDRSAFEAPRRRLDGASRPFAHASARQP
jgi:hypothetical protein